jgi:hypothetical protein
MYYQVTRVIQCITSTILIAVIDNQNDQVKKNEMGGACSTNGGE